jgi:hypothetical protein
MQYQRIRRYCIITCSIDNTSLNKGHADIVAYKGVFIYFLRYSATGCTNQELRLITYNDLRLIQPLCKFHFT